MEPEQYRTIVEWQITQGTPPPACSVASPAPPSYTPSELKKISSFPGIEQNLLLWRVYLNAFNARNWSDLKERFVRDDQGEMQIGPLANDLAAGEELRIASLPGRESHPLDYTTLPGRTPTLTHSSMLFTVKSVCYIFRWVTLQRR
jgi:hypothetical protein